MSRAFDGKSETDWLKASPQGGFARLGNAIIITEDVRKSAAEPSGARSILRRRTRRASGKASQQGLAEKDALQKGLAEKSAEFVKKDAEVYAKA